MGKRELVFHIGGPKCGSSSLQSYLSLNPLLRSVDGAKKFIYAVIDDLGRIRTGAEVQDVVSRSTVQHLSSVPIRFIENEFDSLLQTVLDTVDVDATPILSCEDWAIASHVFRHLNSFEKLNLSVSVVLMVRPQIDWFNSGWWQWGVWTGESLEAWVKAEMDKADWVNMVRRWKSIPGISEIELIDVSTGVVSPFKTFLNVVEGDNEIASNRSSSPALLDFLTRNKKYGRTKHNPEIEEIINCAVNGATSSAPFIITRDLQQYILDRTIDSNRELAEYFSSSEKTAEFLENKRYFDLSAYHGKTVVDVKNYATREDYDELISVLILYLLENERRKERVAIDLGKFDAERYLDLNPDVKDAGENPYVHFVKHGFSERRRYY